MKTRIIIGLIALAAWAHAQTIRPTHWIQDDLRYFQLRGEYWELSPLQRPHTLQNLCAVGLPAKAEWGGNGFRSCCADNPADAIFGWFEFDQGLQHAHNTLTHFTQYLGAGATRGNHFQAFTSFLVDNQLDADSSYIGKRQNGLAAFTDQAYLLYATDRFSFKFGRDYLIWGPGQDAALLISSASRPLDHLYLSWQNRLVSYSFFTASLDRTQIDASLKSVYEYRYLSGHRLEWRVAERFRLGISETVLYGGPGAGLDLALMNPVIFFTGEEHNGPQTTNVMASLDLMVMPLKRLTCYGSFLVDDIQLENQNEDDRGEPAELGVLTGVNVADPFSCSGFDIFAEYTLITNRTYNGQGAAWEKYLHRGVPIGHFLGNDFDRVLAGLKWRHSTRLKAQLTVDRRRRGEGRINKPFDTPWRNLPPGQSYSEPFPTGVVESSTRLNAVVHWRPLNWGYAEFRAGYYRIHQVENELNRDQNGWEFQLWLVLEWFGRRFIDRNDYSEAL
ncbi:MAG: hypothetical protein EHM72_01355 [Calditrichaeota bacterium]|nr:MAG: hypothetical protein EHM72_01355 [Calditrichota bacterium]